MADLQRPSPIGALGGREPAFVDRYGNVDIGSAGPRIEWRVIAEDRFHDPTTSTTLRQLPSDGVIVETAMRIASGDIIERVYASKDHTIIEFENATPAACAVALIVDGETEMVSADRQPMQWCRASDVAALSAQLSRNETTAMPLMAGKGPTGLVWPMAHRTSLRIAIGESRVIVSDLPTIDEVLRAWLPHLRRGLTVDIADRVMQSAIDAARIGALVSSPSDDLALVRALEDWGFDTEAVAAWERLGFLDRRRLSRRHRPNDGASERLAEAVETNNGVALLNAFHDVALCDSGDVVDLFPQYLDAWLGLSVALNNAPVQRGMLSVALRWHGNRPALLWEKDGDFAITASKLDPDFSSTEKSGEVLLAELAPGLFSFGVGSATGVEVTPPGSFS